MPESNIVTEILSSFEKLKVETTEESCNLSSVNRRINEEFCENVFAQLQDKNLLSEYKKTPSVIKKIDTLMSVLVKNNIDNETLEKVIDDYILELIPPGTKGVVKGNRFNAIIKDFLISDPKLNHLEMEFEKSCPYMKTDEIPDWYIHNKTNKKTIIGMNQLDLWSGGHQLNRGSKYLVKSNDYTTKLVCVVCNKIQHKTTKNKAFKLFSIGFRNDTLCYIRGLKKIIYTIL